MGFHGNKPEYHPNRNKEAYASVVGFQGTGVEMLQIILDGSLPIKGDGQSNVKGRVAIMLKWLKGAAPETLKDQIKWLFDPRLAGKLEETEEKKKWIASDLALVRDAALALTQKG